MKFKNGISRKMKRGSLSVIIAAAVLCAVILLNVLVSSLCSDYLLFTDTTPELLYSLGDETEYLMEQTLAEVDNQRAPDDPVQVEIIFCTDPDLLKQDSKLRSVYYTALQLEYRFSENITVSTRNVMQNPSSVDEYRANAYSKIYPTYVIVASGTEYRVYAPDAFYLYSTSSNGTPYAYCGEKTFVKGIMAVTRAEAPICALTVNHGEAFSTDEGWEKYSEFRRLIENAGYQVIRLDLENEPIPENCRLIITFDPQQDFKSDFIPGGGSTGGVSESKKLAAYLDQSYAFMVFVDADTPPLPTMEAYLEEWGIAFNRYETGDAYHVIDEASTLDSGKKILAQYELEGAGGAITKDMRQYSAPPKIVFGNALSISYSPSFEQTYVLADEENGTGAFTHGFYSRNMIERRIYDVFRTTDRAIANAVVNGQIVLDGEGNPIRLTDSPFRLMTITEQARVVGEGQGFTNASMHSYVCAFGSVDFADNQNLSSNAFGNADVLLSLLRTVGREVVPVGLDFKVLHEDAIDPDYLAAGSPTTYTVLLIAIPAVLVTLVGTVVLVKRRARK